MEFIELKRAYKRDDNYHPNSETQPLLPVANGKQMHCVTPTVQTGIHASRVVPRPRDYFLFSLFVLIFGGLPFGIAGLIKSSEVRQRAAAGDLEGAKKASSEARFCCICGLITGFVVMVWITGLIYNIVFLHRANGEG
ncbi:hypothetical protein HOLleu_02528 [Holothuria leucospilota]|uniref:Uncharacterized protein n=1 Tax=Holothuria leucospilota TaxID=206669 RepID=A0A9Q1CPR2_HOLLE|nr:hypothetical protein HOLleu_02528 [Holothuria leucospilota]